MESVDARSIDDDGEQSVDDNDGRKQANRACDHCHKMKMRCIGKEDPPCKRCRAGGHVCTFDGPRKSKSSRVEDRLKFVESQMGSMQNALEELVRLQRAALPVVQPPQQQPMAPPMQHRPSMAQHPTLSNNDYTTPQQMLHMESFINPSQPMSSGIPTPASIDPFFARPPQPTPPWPPLAPPKPPSPVRPSSDPSSDDEDPDPITNNTMRDWDNMFYLAEAARLEADGHVAPGEQETDRSLPSGKRSGTGEGKTGSETKRRRKSRPTQDDDEFAEIKRNLPLQRGDLIHRWKDCVGLGYCDEEKAKQMYNLFMEGSLVYMPCFDPEIDTFESMRKRSPFCLTAVVMVGAKITDAAGPVSELQRQCREHAESIGSSTLFSPVARIEVVQAMIILASWGDTSWRPGGHALRMAMDMGLYRCLPLLVQGGMGRGKSPTQLREEYPLVVGTRVWLTLFKMEFEMAFNLGRPALFAGEETIRNARDFLSHPLSVRNDSRLVATCELLLARAALHQPFAIFPNASKIPDLDEKLMRHDQIASEWFRHWNEYYAAKGIGPGEFLREALVTARCGAELFTNSRILHGVRNKDDVTRMPEHRRARLVKARHAAETLLEMCLRGQQYTKNFAFANLYTHLHIAFAARCLIRLVNLLPEGANTRQIGRDVEKVAQVLTRVPGFQYAKVLREVLGRARRQKVLPPSSRMPSPAPRTTPLPMTAQGQMWNDSSPGALFGDAASSSGFSFGVSPVEGNPFDFTYAEELFSQPRAQDLPQSFMDTSLAPASSFNVESWFPFPPLESGGMEQNPNPTDNAQLNTMFGENNGSGMWW